LMKNIQEKTVVSDVSLLSEDLKKTIHSTDRSIIVDNDKSLQCIFCPECDPQPWDKIIAKSGKEWIKIHTMSCKALKTLSYLSLLEAHRKSDPLSNSYTIHFQLQYLKRKVTIIDIITFFTAFSIPVFKFELENLGDKHMLATIEWEVSNPAKLWFLFSDLTKNHESLEVISKAIY